MGCLPPWACFWRGAGDTRCVLHPRLCTVVRLARMVDWSLMRRLWGSPRWEGGGQAAGREDAEGGDTSNGQAWEASGQSAAWWGRKGEDGAPWPQAWGRRERSGAEGRGRGRGGRASLGSGPSPRPRGLHRSKPAPGPTGDARSRVQPKPPSPPKLQNRLSGARQACPWRPASHAPPPLPRSSPATPPPPASGLSSPPTSQIPGPWDTLVLHASPYPTCRLLQGLGRPSDVPAPTSCRHAQPLGTPPSLLLLSPCLGSSLGSLSGCLLNHAPPQASVLPHSLPTALTATATRPIPLWMAGYSNSFLSHSPPWTLLAAALQASAISTTKKPRHRAGAGQGGHIPRGSKWSWTRRADLSPTPHCPLVQVQESSRSPMRAQSSPHPSSVHK